MGTSRATFKINLTKNNGVLTDRSRVGGKAHKERGEVLKTFILNMFLSGRVTLSAGGSSWPGLAGRALCRHAAAFVCT